jgi:Tol biopolymer transport system component
MNADGTNQNLAPFPPEVWAADDLTWSPDGSRFAFSCRASTKLVGETLVGDLDICVMSTDGTGLKQLTLTPTHDSHPAWSPDGQQILLQVSQPLPGIEHPYWIAVMDASGANLRRVGANVIGMYPSWSPDGSRIVFTSYFGFGPHSWGQGSMWMMNADGSGLVQVTDRSGDNRPVWRR